MICIVVCSCCRCIAYIMCRHCLSFLIIHSTWWWWCNLRSIGYSARSECKSAQVCPNSRHPSSWRIWISSQCLHSEGHVQPKGLPTSITGCREVFGHEAVPQVDVVKEFFHRQHGAIDPARPTCQPYHACHPWLCALINANSCWVQHSLEACLVSCTQLWCAEWLMAMFTDRQPLMCWTLLALTLWLWVCGCQFCHSSQIGQGECASPPRCHQPWHLAVPGGNPPASRGTFLIGSRNGATPGTVRYM